MPPTSIEEGKMNENTCVHAVSAQAFLRIEWTPDWYVLIRQIAVPLALLAGLLWGGAADRLEIVLGQLLN
jgi:hypothetical protein